MSTLNPWSLARRMQAWRFIRIAAIATAGALIASGGHITASVIVGAVAGGIETALRQANPAIPLSVWENLKHDPPATQPATFVVPSTPPTTPAPPAT